MIKAVSTNPKKQRQNRETEMRATSMPPMPAQMPIPMFEGKPYEPCDATQQQQAKQTEKPVEKVIAQSTPVPRCRSFAAKPCTSCKALREAAGDTNNYTRVYATRGDSRYCRCYYCGNTWKDVE